MFTSTKVRSALALFITALLTVTVSSCATGYGSDANPNTSKYLYEQFKEGKYLDPYQTGTADVGATMEGMIQLSGVGYDSVKQSKAIAWLKSNTQLLKSTGLTAEYIFTAHALGFESDPTVSAALSEVTSAIPADSVIAETNNFSYSWVVLGLAAAGEKELANKVAMKLTTLAETDGSYKYVFNDSSGSSTADVTGFSIMAFKATEGFGSAEDEAAKTLAIGRAKTWLIGNLTEKNHWLGYGDIDVSGTAYAAMALNSIGEGTTPYADWLKSRVYKKEGGLITPWTEPVSDVFATIQSILAMSNLSFIDVLKHSK